MGGAGDDDRVELVVDGSHEDTRMPMSDDERGYFRLVGEITSPASMTIMETLRSCGSESMTGDGDESEVVPTTVYI
ncbi:hypothetical protein OsJ_30918 [Oryza sativa Japonica Group]|jgi:hypothetical protein|uniref:Uncharacterized protein n=3 Tax=Oryza TaxID=4527 RepID=Q10A07_ORYSJ|nr:hypothetical protein LOC_Os10g10794 [Oryza sativa Japonica Group]ABG65956.1 hypothetical protein LOC_Os10g10849 [Oryza sativa Japonica Group]EAZ15510.1 hypothetical protein OsJ_30918 [Oryza sativa Japonica Group]